MNYETWCKRSKYLLAREGLYNKWRRKAQKRLLTDIAPRIGALSEKHYMGCGFHYSLEKLIDKLAMPMQLSANHLDEVNNQIMCALVYEVLMRSICEEVVKAEKSIVMPQN